jgi:glycosyltransferase involved in cell wall biosynthesis
MNTIFIQIASYRDPQLLPTIKSILENAKYPKNIRFGICRQYHPEDGFDSLDEYKDDDRFRVVDVLYSESKGVCWARNQVQQLYKNEKYTLQIDSHMRFEKNWDDTLIKMLKGLQKDGYNKPLLTGYVSSFDPDNDPEGRVTDPWRMVFDRFIPEGAVFFLPEIIPDWKKLKSPVPARFYSAHFCFTLGEFSKEVQHDPEFYFHGEEISIAVRAYTHGYDLFHPHKVVVWHEYTRKNRTKQWDDDKDWVNKNNRAHLKNRKLFSIDGEMFNPDDFGIYGFGTKRSLKDYESYAGVRFSVRGVQQYTLDKKYPPNPNYYKTEEEWEKSFSSIFKHCIDIGHSLVPENDYDFWVVAFHDENEETIFRQDADIHEIHRMKQDPEGYCKIWREFQTVKKPNYWIVWPHSNSKGWCDRIRGDL